MSVLTLWKLVIKDKCPPDHCRPPSYLNPRQYLSSRPKPARCTQHSFCTTTENRGHLAEGNLTGDRQGHCSQPTWLALSSGARSACRAFCTSPGRARRAAGRRSPPSWPARSPAAPGTGSGGTPGPRWKCVQPSCHWAWCTCEAKPKGTSPHAVHANKYPVTLNHIFILGHQDLFLLFITSSKTFTKSLALGNLPDVIWIFCLEVFHQGSNWSLELWTCRWRSLQIDLSRVSFWEQGFDKGVVGLPHGLGQVTVQEVIIFVNKSFHLVHNLSNREISLAQVLNYDTDQVKIDPRNWFLLLTHCPKGTKGVSALKSDIWMTFCWIKCLWTCYLRKMQFLILPRDPCVNQFWFLKWKKPFFLW